LVVGHWSFVFALSSVSAIASAQTGVPGAPRTGLTVSLRDPDARGVAGATIVVRDAAGRVVATVTTSADGIARVADITNGVFDIQITAPGFVDAMTNVRVGAGQLVSVELTLTRTAGPPPAPNAVPRPPGIATPPADTPPVPPARTGVPPRPAVEPSTVATPLAPDDKVFVPIPDRWNISLPDWDRYGVRGDYPYVSGHWWDPYNRNIFKGDYPILGDRTFFVFTGVSDTLLEGRNLPVPVAPSSARPLSEPFFGRGDQYLPVAVFRTSFDLFRGDTAFRPIDWRVRVQPAISVNYVYTRETAGVNADVRAGTTRLDTHVGLQEAFVEKKLFDINSNYDFVSVRAGIQELSTDFRGFVAVVEQPGVRVFGTLASSRLEYNGALFDFLEKDTNSGFNELNRRRQQMAVANLYIQDFLTKGYTTELSFHYSRDHGEAHYDHNGFLVRPAPIGLIADHAVRASYFGWAGNGHIGRLNVSHAFYQVTGTDELNPIEAREVDINAQMAAIELSLDKDWLRYKGSFFWASGDDDVNDGRGRGFDSVLDAPVFAGGPFSLWNRQGLRLTQTGTGLVSPISLLPDLRTNKDEGQQNFVNPGIFIVQGGVDAELTPKLRAFTTLSALSFHHTAPLEALLFQSPVRKSIGVDLGGGIQYRPPLSENMVVAAGASLLQLGQGLRDIYSERHHFVSLFANLRLQF
jgi:hypothetical protein